MSECLASQAFEPAGNSLCLRHAAHPGRMLHHPLAFGDGELSQQEKAFPRRRGDPVGIASPGVQKGGLRPLRSVLGEIDEFVLDLEGTQRLEFFQGQDIGHLTLPSGASC